MLFKIFHTFPMSNITYQHVFQIKTITWDLGEIGNAENYGFFEKTLSQTTKGEFSSIVFIIDVRIPDLISDDHL